ncbi:hypothetical protein R6231_14175 [Bacillus cytotoxicus]|uniref:hypothetical protein n=1 Tax=Bacillus cereus group TaxID=86661 RepID=UPI000B97355C|nr:MULTISPECIES: hypothetical protein [Bacillus cereus group]AWC30979.1 hypothetical protein CG483_022435 [Bacillus cytotoxicus]AWC35070.1 hypothetical protein CG482_022720 [Bacillus cytotoxicus]AWC39036.1 hypothetical protein CG481_022310 [Bacillus cytotoxicus]AWC43071.1 hypothetical protein CG480_022270 [Bacillus cytotoxicus]AWC47016.1 hypothetical protein CG479_021680 [Bacillus cytotoxicus]
MENWLFAICMLGVAIVISIIATFLKGIFRMLKGKRKKEIEWVTVMNAEYIDKDFWGRNFNERVSNRNTK